MIISLSAAYFLLILFALAVGSFLNVVIHRLPLMLENHDLSYNLAVPRSHCPHCHTPIKMRHNIPLLSYFMLRGRCARCQSRISMRYPLIEAISCLLALACAWRFGFTLHLPFALLFVWLLIPLFAIDLEKQLLPDPLTLSLLWLGLIANTLSLFTSLPDAVLSAVGAYLGLWLFCMLFYLITKKIGMGHGDFKLFAAFGAWFGWTQLPFILLIASTLGAIVGVIYLKGKKQSKDTPLPFGPFLCLAGILSLFWGEIMLNWYLELLY